MLIIQGGARFVSSGGGDPGPFTPPYSLPGSGASLAIEPTGGGNYASSVKPSGWTDGNLNYSLFNSWSGGAFCPEFSDGGAYVFCACGGHDVPDLTGALLFDFTTGLWERLDHTNGGTLYSTNGNKAYTLSDTNGSPYYEINGSSEVPAPGHSYQTNAYVPPANGGGTKGSIVLVGRGAITASSAVTGIISTFDLDTREWTRRTTTQIRDAAYEHSSVFDPVQGVVWTKGATAHTYQNMQYVNVSDWTFGTTASASSYAPDAIKYDATGSRMLMITPSDRAEPLLFAMGDDGGIYVFDPENPTEATAGGWRQCTMSGSIPASANVMAWNPTRGAAYWISNSTGSTLHKITPSGLTTSALKTGTWTVTTQSISPSVPAAYDSGAGAVVHYTRLMYVPALEMLAWVPGGPNPVYLINPT